MSLSNVCAQVALHMTLELLLNYIAVVKIDFDQSHLADQFSFLLYPVDVVDKFVCCVAANDGLLLNNFYSESFISFFSKFASFLLNVNNGCV